MTQVVIASLRERHVSLRYSAVPLLVSPSIGGLAACFGCLFVFRRANALDCHPVTFAEGLRKSRSYYLILFHSYFQDMIAIGVLYRCLLAMIDVMHGVFVPRLYDIGEHVFYVLCFFFYCAKVKLYWLFFPLVCH